MKEHYCKKCFLKDLFKNCHENRNLDGSGNNKKYAHYGKTNQSVLRKLKPHYEDGHGEPSGYNRPSARKISNDLFHQDHPIHNFKCASNIFWLWGQFIDHDITQIDTHDEPFHIKVPKGDKYFDPNYDGDKYINFNRTVYKKGTGSHKKPRTYTNKLTPFIDASNVYGSTPYRNKYIRSYKDGLLSVSTGDLMPINNGSYANAGSSYNALFVGGTFLMLMINTIMACK